MATTRTHTNHERRVVVLTNLRAVSEATEPGVLESRALAEYGMILAQLSRRELQQLVIVMAQGQAHGADTARAWSEVLS